MKTNNQTHPSRHVRLPFARAVLALAAALAALPSAQAQSVQATGDVNPFPSPNPRANWNIGASTQLDVGNSGTGSLTITDGGTAFSGGSYIGKESSGQGSVTVSGAGSAWTNYAGAVRVGYSGTGSLTITNGGAGEGDYGVLIGENSSGQGSVTVSGAGSILTNSNPVTVGYSGTGSLTITDGGTVSTTTAANMIGRNNGSQGSVTVSGAGSTWNNGGLGVGFSGTGSLAIANGGTVSSSPSLGSYSFIGYSNGSQGSVLVTGAGSTWTNTRDLILGGTPFSATTAIGTLTVEKGGTVAVGGTLKLHAGGTVAVEVSGNNAVTVGGDVSNDGVIRFTAAPSLSAGDYTPLSVTGSWSGTGSYEAIGGVWNLSTHLFTVAAAQAADAGSQATVNLGQTQRLAVTGVAGQQVTVAFNSAAEASGGGSTITFTASENTVVQIGGGAVLSAWDFQTNLDFSDGSTVQLSFDVGSGFDSNLFTVWHSSDGTSWTLFDTEITYDGAHASFLVDGFSSYAITASAIPEPAAFATLAALGGLALAASRRKRRA